jgi:hypothetical protein
MSIALVAAGFDKPRGTASEFARACRPGERCLITDYSLWKYVHVLLFVYWLGADLGVFLLARAVKRADLSFDQRALMLRMAMLIDATPRIAFVLMFPVGLELAVAMGVADPPALLRGLAWIVAAAWLAIVLGIGRNEGRPRAAALTKANLTLQGVLLVVLLGVGAYSVLGHGPFAEDWLAWKILLFALVFLCSIMIDREFGPLVPAFGRLATEGSTPDVEAAIREPIDGAIRWVLLLYGLLLVIAFLGTTHWP